MGNDPTDVFESRLNELENIFKRDLLDDRERERWPDVIDYVAARVADDDNYPVGFTGAKAGQVISSGEDLDTAASEHYLNGITELTDDTRRRRALPRDFQLGKLLVQFSELQNAVANAEADIAPGEALGRLITRKLQRQSSRRQREAAREITPETSTPRELVAELTAHPELADSIRDVLPSSNSEGPTLVQQLAHIDLTTPLWDHQLDALEDWLQNDMHGYVNMATATGKTVLGLAAAAYIVDAGSLHPSDREKLRDRMTELPKVENTRSDDILIVTTDKLLGVQWARLFQEHCHTPPEYTEIENNSIKLPWGTIDIRAADAVSGLDPSSYRLAIFDEVHNYSSKGGWGHALTEFIESPCSVLALTGSETGEFKRRIAEAGKHFPRVGDRYTHQKALDDGIIPDFTWSLTLTGVKGNHNNTNIKQLMDSAEAVSEVINFEDGRLQLTREKLDQEQAELSPSQRAQLAGTYETGNRLASQLRDDEIEKGPDAPTELLERIAHGLSNRSIHRLNLSTDTTIAIDLALDAINNDQPVLILTRSYSETKQIYNNLQEKSVGCKIVRLENNQNADKHDELIQEFDSAETDQKVLIGPGKRIGQGNDIQTVEIGINIAQPGTGANTTLIQRLGRLLRKSSGKSSVTFHHVLGVQPSETIIPPDGESFVRNIASFFEEAITEATDEMSKPPTVDIDSDSVASSVAKLERDGAPHVLSDDQLSEVEESYAQTIVTASDDHKMPVLGTEQFRTALGIQQSESINHSDNGQTGRQSDDGPSRNNSEDQVATVGSEADNSINDQNTDQTPSKPDVSSQAGADMNNEHTIDIDPVLLALVTTEAERPDTEYESQAAVVNAAAESFVSDNIADDVDVDHETLCQSIDRRIEFSADPILDQFLAERVSMSSLHSDISDFVEAALYEYTELDSQNGELQVDGLEQMKFSMKTFIEQDQYPYETRDDVIRAAIRRYFSM